MMLLALPLALLAAPADPLDACNVIWNTPSRDSAGSMPFGNGDLAGNLWVTDDGGVQFYLAKTDAWDQIGRLLKLGRVRVTLDPNPFVLGRPFVQTLQLRQGTIAIVADGVTVRVWADAHAPVIHVEVDSPQPVAVAVSAELWRTRLRHLTGPEMFSAYGQAGSAEPLTVEPDTVLDLPGQVAWAHRNETSCVAATLRLQGLGELVGQAPDPLLHRTFGALLEGPGLVRREPLTLATAAPVTHAEARIHVLTAQTPTLDAWVAALQQQAAAHAQPAAAVYPAHLAWWDAFWNRSWIRVTDDRALPHSGGMTVNQLPLRIGADSDGQPTFRGTIRRARVYRRALSPEEVAAHAQDVAAPAARDGLVGDWDLARRVGQTTPNLATEGLAAQLHGTVDFAADGARFDGHGWLEVAPDPRLDLTDAVTLEAWLKPGAQSPAGGRVLDKSKAGTANGYLLDTYPGHSLRLITEPGTLVHDAKLPVGQWVHVAATFDAETGLEALYVNGQSVRTQALGSRVHLGNVTVGQAVTRGYALQRFLFAAAGRGAQPIKFNGSLFTVDALEGEQRLDADYRRWGDTYWFQNTRLAYWPMLAAGDLDSMEPLWRMFRESLPLATARTKLYFGHDGAFFPETMTFWGAYANQNYGWHRAGHDRSYCENTYIRWYWSGALELLVLLLDRYAQQPDAALASQTLLPLARGVLTFYDQHYPRAAGQPLRVYPGQSLETWQDAANPTPDVAGLQYVLDRLLALPADTVPAPERQAWTALRAALPPVPLGHEGDRTFIKAAGEIFGDIKNVENPELYAVFPYRLFTLGRAELATGRESFRRRRFTRSGGWQQDAIHAAWLGLTAEAQAAVVHNFTTAHATSRFPAFWGPNYDWVPDQDHGGVAMMGLQHMLMQCEGDTIRLLPAWPPEWDVAFKLHAPGNTVVEGVVREGKVVRLTVTPEARRRDVVRPEG